ncbi:MAG: class I SAM-dependent methyltransferase [Gemmatimonadaceae bacterium]
MSADVVSIDIRRAYDAWHAELSVDGDADAPWHRLVRFHLEPGRDLAGKRVLEIGCGRGGFACWLAGHAERPAEVVAADFSATAVHLAKEFAARHHVAGVRWEVGDIQAIDHPDASFDTVISCETIEHVPDPRRAIRELARVLKPGGRLFLTTPNYLGIYGLYRAYRRVIGRPYTEHGQPINNLVYLPLTRRWIARTSLRVVQVDATGHYLLWPGRVPVELPRLNEPRAIMRWFGLHSLVVAEQPLAARLGGQVAFAPSRSRTAGP